MEDACFQLAVRNSQWKSDALRFMYPKGHWSPSKSVHHPLCCHSPTAYTIWIPDDWSVFSRAGWRPGMVCGGGQTSGDVLVQSVLHWTPGHPILIRFAAAAICPSSMINPGCYLAPTGCTVNTVCVCAFHTSLLQRHSFKDLLRHQNVFGINITGVGFLDFLQDALAKKKKKTLNTQ